MKPSTYYYKTRFFLDTSSLSKKKYSNSKSRGFCYTVNGDKVPDEFVIAELIKIKEHLNMYVSKHYLKTLGSTKLCEYFKKKYCQAFIEFFHSSVQREFVPLNTFTSISDFTMKYKVYLEFYNNIRPHGSLNYLTPNEFHDLYKENRIEIKGNKEKLTIFEQNRDPPF